MLKWKQPSDSSYLRLHRLRSAYDLVKTTLSEAEAEAEEPNQSQRGNVAWISSDYFQSLLLPQ